MAVRNRAATLTLLLLAGIPAAAHAQFFGVCESGRPRALDESIKAHQEHILRLSKKFEDVWYFQGPLPAARRAAAHRARDLDAALRVVMTLWRVDDAATRELMGEFVRRLAAEPPDRALNLAMRWLRDRKDDPALWAGFAVFGLPESGPAR